MEFNTLKDPELKQQIEDITQGYKDKTQFFVDRLARGVAMIAAGFYPKDVIVRMSDFKTNEYANLIGGHLYEPKEDKEANLFLCYRKTQSKNCLFYPILNKNRI